MTLTRRKASISHPSQTQAPYLGPNVATASYISQPSFIPSNTLPAAGSLNYSLTPSLSSSTSHAVIHDTWHRPSSHDPYVATAQLLPGPTVIEDQFPSGQQQQDPDQNLLTPVTHPSSSLPNSRAFSWGLELGEKMQDYPSPYSEPLEPGPSSMIAAPLGLKMSPIIPVGQSPSNFDSSPSSKSVRGPMEPTRNAEGVLYCAFEACAKNPPTFPRRCEWT